MLIDALSPAVEASVDALAPAVEVRIDPVALAVEVSRECVLAGSRRSLRPAIQSRVDAIAPAVEDLLDVIAPAVQPGPDPVSPPVESRLDPVSPVGDGGLLAFLGQGGAGRQGQDRRSLDCGYMKSRHCLVLLFCGPRRPRAPIKPAGRPQVAPLPRWPRSDWRLEDGALGSRSAAVRSGEAEVSSAQHSDQLRS